MNVMRTVSRLSGIIFDIDNTLYRNRAYTDAQTDLLVGRLAEHLGRSCEDMKQDIAARRRQMADEAGGRTPSLANIFLEYNVDIATSVQWREELLDPSAYLHSDPALRSTLSALGETHALVAVTNNPSSVGRATLSVLGVESQFAGIVGLDDSGVSKPHAKPFQLGLQLIRAASRWAVPASEVVSIGDRIPVDLEPAMELGMGAVLVESMEDVYALDSGELLTARAQSADHRQADNPGVFPG
ncbi:MAG: HAD family hydrolase [Spirochaetales bacterium]